MSVTDTKLEYAIEIDCTDSTSATLESVGLYGGFFRFATGYADDYDSKTWTTGLLVDGGIDRASVAVDLSETGGYSPEGSFGFVIAGSTNIVSYLDTYQIKLIGRTVRVWAAVGALFVPIWAGIVDTYGETDSGFQFACTVDFKARHNTIPPNVTDSGDVIPVVFGKVSKSPTTEIIGISPPLYPNAYAVNERDDGVGEYEVILHCYLPWAYYQDLDNRVTTLIEDVYFSIVSGTFSETYMSNSTVYKIDSIDVGIVDPGVKAEVLISTTAVICATTAQNIPVTADDYSTVWTLSFFTFDNQTQISNTAITEAELSDTGLPKTYIRADDVYVDVSVVVDTYDNPSIAIAGVDSPLVSESISLSGVNAGRGFFGTTRPDDLFDNTNFVAVGNLANLYDRDADTFYGLEYKADNAVSYNYNGNLSTGLCKIYKSDLIDGVDDYYFAFSMQYFSGTAFCNLIPGTNATYIKASPPWATTSNYDQSSGYLTGVYSANDKLSHIPKTWYTAGVDIPTDISPRTTTDLSDSFKIPSNVIDDLRSGKLYTVEIMHDIETVNVVSTLNQPVDISIRYFDCALIAKYGLAEAGNEYYVGVNIGEANTVNVLDAIDHILVDYDGFTSFVSEISTRTTWPIGRTLTERKSSAEYLDELCRNAFMVGFVSHENLLTFRTWIDNTTPVYAFNGNNIIRDSITDWNYSPISTVYNDIAAFAGYDYGAGEFADVYKITNTNEASFPIESGDWQKYVVGQSDYATAAAAWEKARAGVDQTGVVQILPSSLGELPWFRAEAATAVDSAWEFASLCAYWLSVQKLGCQFSASINAGTLALRLADPITVNDPIYSNNVALLGWISGIDIDRDAKEINYTVQFAPIVAEESYIYETGTAPDTITELGYSADPLSDTITEGA